MNQDPEVQNPAVNEDPVEDKVLFQDDISERLVNCSTKKVKNSEKYSSHKLESVSSSFYKSKNLIFVSVINSNIKIYLKYKTVCFYENIS